MAHQIHGCQFEYGLGRALCTLFACTILWSTITVAAQQPGKPEADAVALARQTLAATQSLALDRIKTVSVAPTQWRDSSLGCPERGMTYTPALTSGYQVTLLAGEREHVVHVAGGRAVICGSPSDSKRMPAAMISVSLKAADEVRKAVALRLGIEPSRVRIVSTRPFRSATACPTAPASPKGAALIVEVEAEAQTFRYYTDDTRVVTCDENDQRGVLR